MSACSSKRALLDESRAEWVGQSSENAQQEEVGCKAKPRNDKVEHAVLVDFISAYGYLASGQYLQARSAVQLLLNKYPQLAMTHVVAADLLKAESNPIKAIEHLRRASELAPGDGQIKASLAQLNQSGGRN